MLPSAVNDTMRDMMAQIRDVGDGIRGGTYTMTAPVITGGSITGVALSGNTLTNPVITGGSINNTTVGATTRSTGAFTTLASNGATTFTAGTASTSTTTGTAVITGGLGVSGRINAANFDGIVGANTAAAGTFTSLTDSGNLTFTGTGNRITGDFSNATLSNRVAFQSSTTNGNTALSAFPNGTAVASNFTLYNNSDPTNAGTAQIAVNASEARFSSTISGTGTYLPLTMFTGGSERLRIDTSGNVGIGTSSPLFDLQVQNSSSTISLGGTPTTNGTGRLKFINSNAVVNWQISTNDSVGGAFEFTPSTAAGGSTFTTPAMLINSSGNVGIGTSSPAKRLDVIGAGDSQFRVGSAAATSYDIGRVNANGLLQFYGNQSGANGFIFTGADGERMRIDSSGNVGIGTSSPSGKLDVAGTIKTLGYTVATLPAGVTGMRAYVTDALAPSFGVTVAGSGAVTIPVFYNGANWIVA
jgi:hypothetical protein